MSIHLPSPPTRADTHRIRRRIFGCLLIALSGCGCAFSDATDPRCTGPAELERIIASHPSSAAYDALGAYFGQQNQLSCAIAAFQSALKLAPESWEAHYNLAIALLDTGNAEHAVRELRATARLKPGSPQIELALGTALSHAQQLDSAIIEFKEVLKTDPKSVPALDGLTKAFIAQKRFSAATAYLKNAPADEVLQLNLAIAYAGNNNQDEAIKILAAIVKAHPDYAQAHSNLAIVYTQQSRYFDASQEFKEALRLDPADDVIRVSYIKTLVLLAQFETAYPLAAEYLERKPRDFDALYLMGTIDRGLGKNAEAEQVLAQSVALAPNHYDSRYNYGFVLAKLGKTEQARAQLEKALQLKPDSSEARFQLANVLRSLGRQDQATEQLKIFEQKKQETVQQDVAGTKANQANQDLQSGEVQKAIDLYKESLAQDPNNARTYYDLALAYDRLSDTAAERDALNKSVGLDPKFAPARNQLGFLSLRSGHIADAERQLKAAIALDPQYAEAQGNLGVLYGQQGRNSEAEQLLRQAIENDPEYTQAYINLGLILASESRLPEAEEMVRHAAQLEPQNTSALTADAMILTHLKRNTEAIEEFRKVADLDPQAAGAHLNLGIALADQFDLNGSLAQFSDAVRLDPMAAPAHYNKGRVLLDLQRPEDAKPELNEATRLDPNTAEAWYLLGLVARQSGDTGDAIQNFKKAVALAPSNANARFMLGRELQHNGDNAAAAAEWRKAISLQPDYGEALYNLSRLLLKTDPEEAKKLQARFDNLQARRHIMDRAQTLGNFALASEAAHDWPQAISQLKEGIQLCGDCSALPLLRKDLGLIYCHHGDLKDGRTELIAAQKLLPADPDIKQALAILGPQK